MFKRSKKAALEEGHTNNIWNKHDFAMCGLGEKSRFWATLKHFGRCIKRSKQRIVRGYADSDIWNMYGYLQTLLPDMLEYLKINRFGSPGYLGENYTNENGSARKFAEEMISSGTVEAIRKEKGNIRYDYFYPIDDAETVLLIDSWENQEAIDVHHGTPMMDTIFKLREKYNLHMKVERYISNDEIPETDKKFIKE